MAVTRISILILLLVFAVACRQERKAKQPPDDKQLREYLEAANQLLIDGERQEIKDMVERHGWNMVESPTGLWFQIYDKGEGRKVNRGDIAIIHYSISLATGDKIYASNPNEPKQFQVGRGGVETGLEEGILMMRIGDKARFVLPSHLAHGVPGDGVRIPTRATIIYNVELVDLL